MPRSCRSRADMSISESDAEIRESTRAHVSGIWKRARINAFAHRRAARVAGALQSVFVVANVILALSAVTFIVVYYLFSQQIITSDGISVVAVTDGRKFILVSIVSTILGIGVHTLQVHFRFGVQASRHWHSVGSFLSIAQRSREVEWPGIEPVGMGELVRDLERDFQLLKARGFEPSDRDFDAAVRIFKKIQDDETTRSMQSF